MLGFSPNGMSYSGATGMAADWHDSSAHPAGGPLGGDVAARVEAIVHAAEREARAVEQAIADRRRSAEEEVERYLASTRLHADAEAAARAARLASFGAATRRLANELADATAALTQELQRSDAELAQTLPRAPWPTQAAAPPPPPPVPEPAPTPAPQPAADAPAPTWARQTPPTAAAPPEEAPAPREPAPAPAPTPVANGADVPSAARLVAIEMAVGGAARSDVEHALREEHGIADPQALLDDVFGAASHAGSTLAWGEP